MTSANTPYLIKILDKLESIDIRLTNVESRLTNVESRLTNVESRLTNVEFKLTSLEKRVSSLESDVHNIKRYIKRESDIQETDCTNFIKQHIESNRIFARVTSIQFGKFFTPNSNQELTDIDGCLMVETPSVMVKNDNGRNQNLTYSATYIIEAKHGLTMSLVNKKLKQFVIMLQIIQKIKQGNVQSSYKNFNTMVVMNSMRSFPTPVYFIFGSDDIDENLQEYIQCISSTCDKKSYYDAVFKNVKTHEIVYELIHNSDIHQTLRTMLKKSSNLTELLRAFDESYIRSKCKPTPQLLSGLEAFLQCKQSILNLFEPYESVAPTMNVLKGLLGFRSHDEKHMIPAPNDN